MSFATGECRECWFGWYRPAEVLACIQCPDGKTTNSRGSASEDDCVDIGKLMANSESFSSVLKFGESQKPPIPN